MALAAHFSFPLSGSGLSSHVVVPSAHDHHHHHGEHGHHHDDAAPDHDHGSFGHAVEMWTMRGRTAFDPNVTHMMSLPVAEVEMRRCGLNDPVVNAHQLHPIRLDPPPRKSLSVLLI